MAHTATHAENNVDSVVEIFFRKNKEKKKLFLDEVLL